MTVRQYIQKEVEVSAVQYTGWNGRGVLEFAEGAAYTTEAGLIQVAVVDDVEMETLEMHDYLVKLSGDAQYTIYTEEVFNKRFKPAPVPTYEDIEIVTHCGCKGVVTVTTGVMVYIKPLETLRDGRPLCTNREFGDTGEVSNGRRLFKEV